MFKVLPFFQKHFRKCGIPAYINQQSFFPTGLLGPSYGDSPSPTTSEQTETEVSKNSPCSTSSRQFNSSCATSSGEQGQPSHLQTIDSLIDSLRPLEKITLVRTRVVRKTLGFLHDSGIMVTEFELLNEQEEKVFDVEIQQGDLMEEFGIKIFGSNSDIALCSMYLESDMEIKGLVLKITLPPGNMIGSVMEMKGMSKITFIKNEKNEMVYQVFTHRGLGGFGWTTSAKILNPEGNEKLGDLQINKQQGPDLLSITVNLPKTKEVNILNKALVLGSVLVLIKDY